MSLNGDGERAGLTPAQHARLAELLHGAARARRSVEPFSARYSGMTVEDARRIRDALLTRRLADGEQPIGAKVWLARYPVGRLWGPEPHVAWLTDRMLLCAPTVDLTPFIRPRAEPKLALRLDRPLGEPIVSVAKVLAATGSVCPCVEVVDVRYDGEPEPVDEVADNGGAACLRVGAGVPVPAEGLLRRVRVELDVDAVPAPTDGRDAAAVSPLGAIAWLGNEMTGDGRELAPGTLLVSPALAPAVELTPGMHARWRFGDFGEVELRTGGEPPRHADGARPPA